MKILEKLNKVRKLFSKRADEKEMADLDRWLNKISNRNTINGNEGQEAQKKLIQKNTWNIEKAWDTLEKKMYSPDKIQIDKTYATYKRKTKEFNPVIRFAVYSITLLIIGIASYYVVDKVILPGNVSNHMVSKELAAEKGSIKRLVLSDGSLITLNAESELEIDKNYGKKDRRVKLRGEAYFEIIHNPKLPFIVEAGGIMTKVLGTKFDVKAFPDEKELSVSLVSGRVKVTKTEAKGHEEVFILKPTEQVVFNDSTDSAHVGTFNELETTGWKNNTLIFNNTELGKVLRELNRAYGVKFELDDKNYNELKISANFNNETFWTVVKSLKSLTGLKYKTKAGSGKILQVNFYK